jgi:serine protease
MHKFGALGPFVAFAVLLSACSVNGTTSSLPSSTQGLESSSVAAGQSLYPRSEVGPDGHIIAYFYKREIELGGLVGKGVMNSAGTAGTNNLQYNGGPVQTAPKIYVDFWGSGWSNDPDGVKAYYTAFAGKMIGSTWMSTVTQYNVGNTTTALGGTWSHSATLPNLRSGSYQSAFAAEARNAAAHFGDHSANASYVIMVPHGVKVNGFGSNYCAWHSDTSTTGGTIAYTNLPYQPDAGFSCGVHAVNSSSIGVNDGVSIVGGHEQAETETDPELNAWFDASGSEIGDKCAWRNLQDTSFGGSTLGTSEFATQPLWSNSAGGCVQ